MRDLHRHAIEQALRRWRGGHDSAVAETSRDNFIFAQANAHRLQRFISELGAMEPAILADRRREAEREQRRFSRSHNGKTIPDGTENVTAASAPGLTNSDREKYYLRTLGISSLILCGNQILRRVCSSTSTASTRRLLDGVAMLVPHRSTEPARQRHRRKMTK